LGWHLFDKLDSRCSAFIAENLAFLSMDNEDWWFNLTKYVSACFFTV
jgi:hypothetical protein